jgi:DnaJ-class molecular chaperone
VRLSATDKIEVFKLCMGCGGEKVIKDSEGNESECPRCKGMGETSERVMLRDFVDFIGEAMAREIRRAR